MQAKTRISARLGMLFALALLVCAPMAMAQSGRISIQGHVTGMISDGAGFRVTLDNGGYTYWVPSDTINERHIRNGDYVRFDGYGDNGLVTVDGVVWLGDRDYRPYYGRPMYSSSPEAMTGIVQNVNRHYNYLTLRAEGTGRLIRVDLRNMDTRESINVWRLRPGDRVNVTGGWEDRGRFQADRVFF